MQFDKNVLPTAIAVSEKYATTEINKQINSAIEKVINDMDIKTSDFYNNTLNKSEQLNYLSVDTMLINDVCAKSAFNISENLNKLEDKKIKLPVGLLSGVKMLSNYGPRFSITISALGDAEVDYSTSFEAVGINQINFQVWLNIQTSVTIVNPLYSKDIIVKRKLMLVNTVFNGEVPDTYLDFMNRTGSIK